MNKANESFIDLDLNTNKFTEQLLLPLETGVLPLLHDRVIGVPGMDGFHYMFGESGDAALFHVAKRGLELVTGAVVWGNSDALFHWLIDYRTAQLPWVPGCEGDLPKASRLPWAAFMFHLGVATLSKDELKGVQTFRKRLVANIVQSKSK